MSRRGEPMSTDLHQRLADLAGHPPPASPPDDLWVRGVRRRRAAAVGRAAVAVVLAFLVGVGGWTWHQARPIQPADTHGSPHLPDRFFRPSPWTHQFAGPPGQLVTVFPSERKTLLHDSVGLVGVTAASGGYGFLDVPDDAVSNTTHGGGVALSPNGRSVAFWTSGTPAGTPNTQMEFGATITGVATYDAVTGRVHKHRIATEHGLDPTLLLWSDDDSLMSGTRRSSDPTTPTTNQPATTRGPRSGTRDQIRLSQSPGMRDSCPAPSGRVPRRGWCSVRAPPAAPGGCSIR